MLGSDAGDGLSSSLAGMSKNQLYDIMSQMKTLIEHNQQQARQILIQNPLLNKALFQAQIMLGMVHPPQAIPNIQPTVSQPPTQSMHPIQPINTQALQSLPKQSDLHDQTSASQTSAPIRRQHQLPPMVPPPSTSAPMNFPPPPLPSHTLHTVHNPQNTAIAQAPQMSLPQSFQLHHNIPHQIQPTLPMSSSQLQQPLPGMPHMLMQPPLPPQPRPPSMPSFSHQPQMGSNTGFQHPGAPQFHHSQTMFLPGMKPPGMKPPGMGPSFPQRQPQRPSQPPSLPMYQVGNPHLNTEFGNQLGSSMQPERGGGSTWMPGLPDINMAPPSPPPPSLGPSSQMGQANQPPRPAPLTPEMEQALLQQVMSLTQEQINLLPPEQRNQVLQLQQMLRQ